MIESSYKSDEVNKFQLIILPQIYLPLSKMSWFLAEIHNDRESGESGQRLSVWINVCNRQTEQFLSLFINLISLYIIQLFDSHNRPS